MLLILQGTLLRGQTGTYPHSPFGTLGGSHSPGSPNAFNANGVISPSSMNSLAFDGAADSLLADSPPPSRDVIKRLYHPKSYAEKARINAG